MRIPFRISGPIVIAGIAACLWLRAQDQNPDQTTFHVKVDMVVLSFDITDTHGKYVNGIKPSDFKVYEDDIPQKVATFAEGNHAPVQVLANGSTRAHALRYAGCSQRGAPHGRRS